MKFPCVLGLKVKNDVDFFSELVIGEGLEMYHKDPNVMNKRLKTFS